MNVKGLMMIGWSVFLLGAMGAGAQDTGKQPTERDKAILRLTAAAALFRTSATETGGLDRLVGQWGSAAFKTKWAKDVGSLFEKEEQIEWADFFSSAMVWIGGVKDSKGVAGFYSPWSDGLLLVQMEATEKQTQLMDFAVVSGESLRGGAAKSAPPEASLSLFPPNEPLIIALARLYGPASAQFAELYPLEGDKPALLAPGLALRLDSPLEETIMVKARMLMRMKMFKDYLDDGNRDWVKAAVGIRDALRSGDEQTLLGTLTASQNVGAVKAICALPKALLKGVKLNYFIPAKDGALAGFLNPDAPRWVIAVTWKGKPQAARIAQVELLDVEVSDKVVSLWNKEGAK